MQPEPRGRQQQPTYSCTLGCRNTSRACKKKTQLRFTTYLDTCMSSLPVTRMLSSPYMHSPPTAAVWPSHDCTGVKVAAATSWANSCKRNNRRGQVSSYGSKHKPTACTALHNTGASGPGPEPRWASRLLNYMCPHARRTVTLVSDDDTATRLCTCRSEHKGTSTESRILHTHHKSTPWTRCEGEPRADTNRGTERGKHSGTGRQTDK